MKKRLTALLVVLALLLLALGCTVDEASYNVIIDDVGGDAIAVDEATGAIVTISLEHEMIHDGDSFSCWYLQDVSDIADKTIITFKTPDTTKWVHIIPTGSATFMAHFRILEDPKVTDNTGATLDIYNRDRNSAVESTVIDTSQNPDVAGQATYFTIATMGSVTGGTEITHEHLGTGEGKKTLGGGSRGTQEWILKQDTLYAFVIESVTADDNTHVVILNWYEHTNNE